jgi:hypothetical protein
VAPDPGRLKIVLLRALDEAHGSISSAALARTLRQAGFEISARTVRLHLEELERAGLVDNARRGRHGGRAITPRGVQEISDASAHDRVGLLGVRMDTLACQMTFDPLRKEGSIVLNLTIVAEENLKRAAAEMIPVFGAGLSMGRYVALFAAGESVGTVVIPRGHAGIGTVCSVTLNGALLRRGIPTEALFGGVIELARREPVRFTDIIHYQGTSLDPLEVFIRSGLTSARQAARAGNGRIGASFRTVPSCALKEVERVTRRLEEVGLGGVLRIGRPDQPLLGFPLPEGRTGLVVAGGLNPSAAVQEAGIPARHLALAHFYEFAKLVPFHQLARL